MISIIIPTYNRANLIKRAIQSALEQSYNDIEVIVVDDGSTDNTSEVVKDIDDSRFRYIYNEHKNGNAARNRGISEAKGEYIALLDSDDSWNRDKLKIELDTLNKYDADVCFCDLIKYYEGSDNSVDVITFNGEAGIVPYKIAMSFAIYPCTIIGKRDVFLNEKFDEDLPRMQGYEWQIRALRNKKICYTHERLTYYYVQNDSISSTGAQKRIDAATYILNKYRDNYAKENKNISSYLLKIIIADKIRISEKPYRESVELFKNEKNFKNFIRLLLITFGLTKYFTK